MFEKLSGGIPVGEMVTLYSGKRGSLPFIETGHLDNINIYNNPKKNLTRIEDGNIITTSAVVKPSKLLNNLIGRIMK